MNAATASRRAIGLFTLLALTSAATAQQEDSVLVLTSLPATFSIVSALAADTRIVVRNLPAGGRSMGAQGNYFERQADALAEEFENATAVVTIAKLWRDDPLYLAARSANIRVVDIDATKPWSTSLEGIAVVLEPVSDVPWAMPPSAERSPSVYFWLSPANGARSAEIVAADLARLAPADSEQITANLVAFRRELLELKRDYEVLFAGVLDVTVLALAPEFVYLTSDMGLYVDGHFFKQDIDWTDSDYSALTAFLRERNIRVVIHKWDPEPPIVAAIEAADAQLVVLDTLETGLMQDGTLSPDSYMAILRHNLEALDQAFRAN